MQRGLNFLFSQIYKQIDTIQNVKQKYTEDKDLMKNVVLLQNDQYFQQRVQDFKWTGGFTLTLITFQGWFLDEKLCQAIDINVKNVCSFEC